MSESPHAAAGPAGFTMMAGDDALTCTDQTCLLPSVADAASE